MFIFIALIVLIICIVLYLYRLNKSYSEEKQIIKTLIDKYLSYIRRFTAIYEEILLGESLQAGDNLGNKIQDVNDDLTLDAKKNLLSVIKDKSIYRVIIQLNGYFSRIKDWERDISASDFQSSQSITHSSSISRMLQAFMGDVHHADGSFYRYDFKEYIEDITAILDYINRINTHFIFRFLALVSSKSREETGAVGNFIVVKESELDSLRWRLEKLRLVEEKYRLEKKESLTPSNDFLRAVY